MNQRQFLRFFKEFKLEKEIMQIKKKVDKIKRNYFFIAKLKKVVFLLNHLI